MNFLRLSARAFTPRLSTTTGQNVKYLHHKLVSVEVQNFSFFQRGRPKQILFQKYKNAKFNPRSALHTGSSRQNVVRVLVGLRSLIPKELVQSGKDYLNARVGKRARYVGVGVFGAISGAAYFLNQDKAPITGRRRMLLIKPKDAMEMGVNAVENFKAMYGEANIVPNLELSRVMNKLLDVNPELTEHIPKSDWKVFVLKDEATDAFAFPNGSLFIFEGMLKFATTDDQRAILLGHEMSHVIMSHAAELSTREHFHKNLMHIGATAIMDLIGMGGVAHMGGSWAFDQIYEMTTKAPHSIEIEKEANYVGLMLASKACYNPRAGITFFNKLARHDLESVNDILMKSNGEGGQGGKGGEGEDEHCRVCEITQMPSWKEKLFKNAESANYIEALQPQAQEWRASTGKCPPEEVLPPIKSMGVTALQKDVDRLVAVMKARVLPEYDPRLVRRRAASPSSRH